MRCFSSPTQSPGQWRQRRSRRDVGVGVGRFELLNLRFFPTTVRVPPSWHVVGVATLDMVQPWAELDVAARHGLVICKLDGCRFPIAFVLMLDLLYARTPVCGPARVACLWIGPRLAIAARCGSGSIHLSYVVQEASEIVVRSHQNLPQKASELLPKLLLGCLKERKASVP